MATLQSRAPMWHELGMSHVSEWSKSEEKTFLSLTRHNCCDWECKKVGYHIKKLKTFTLWNACELGVHVRDLECTARGATGERECIMKSLDWTMHWKKKKKKTKKEKNKAHSWWRYGALRMRCARQQATGGKCGTTKGVGCCWNPKTQWPLGKSQLTKIQNGVVCTELTAANWPLTALCCCL